jgi:hypothetical protein
MSQQVNILTTCMSGSSVRTALIGRACCRIVLLVMAASCATAVRAAEWRVDVVDASAGMFSSMKFDLYGNAHVSYLDPSQHQLRYAFWDHILRKWFNTNVDKSGGPCTLALDSHQRPHISYLNYGGGLMYAHWDGASWQKQKIPVPSRTVEFYTSIALDQNDHPSISFYEVDNGEGERVGRLRSLMWNGKFWALTTVDHTLGTGKFNSIAVDSSGHPHIAYATVNYENASLRYGYWNGESWKTQIVEGGREPAPSWSVSMVLDKDNNPHVTYTDVSHLLVKYATKRDGQWKIESVDSLTKQGYPDRNGIALDDQGNLYMSYYDAGAGLLKVAHREGQKWVAEVVDGGFAGLQSSLQIDHGAIWITYASEADGGLKVARRPLGERTASPGQSVSPSK